jgi:hypothetical protein
MFFCGNCVHQALTHNFLIHDLKRHWRQLHICEMEYDFECPCAREILFRNVRLIWNWYLWKHCFLIKFAQWQFFSLFIFEWAEIYCLRHALVGKLKACTSHFYLLISYIAKSTFKSTQNSNLQQLLSRNWFFLLFILPHIITKQIKFHFGAYSFGKFYDMLKS